MGDLASQKIRIRMKAYDFKLLDQSAGEIVDTAMRTGARVAGPIPLPTSINKYTVLRGPHILADKKNVEIGTVTDFAAAEFSQADDRQVAFTSPQAIDDQQACFRERRLFRENRREISETKNIAQQNSKLLSLAIGAQNIE